MSHRRTDPIDGNMLLREKLMADSTAPPTRRQIDAIIALDADAVLRNLKITQCYHDLSISMAGAVGAENLNWCAFATWASKTAGRFVRGEPLAMFRDSLVNQPKLTETLDRLNFLLRRFDAATGISRLALLAAIEAPVREVSGHIAAGNLAVFTELAPLFSLLSLRLDTAAEYDSGLLGSLLDALQLKPGASENGGQDSLRRAVSGFFQARFEGHAERKAECMLLANALTGLHEQVRLQPAIAGALELPFAAVMAAFIDHHFASGTAGTTRRRLRGLTLNAAKPLLARLERELNRVWHECVTGIFMTLRLPEGEIHLGKDLRPLPGGPLFPKELQAIENGELRALLVRFRADGASALASGATDWADWPNACNSS